MLDSVEPHLSVLYEEVSQFLPQEPVMASIDILTLQGTTDLF